MTQYDEKVQRQKERLEAIEWGKGVKDLHTFNSDDCNMWYDKEPDENGKRDGRVIDLRFNNGLIKRTITETGEVYIIGEEIKGKSLINEYIRNVASKLRGVIS